MTDSLPCAASGALANAAAQTRWSILPPAVRTAAADLFLDTLAVIAAGAVHPSYRPWLDSLGHDRGPCTALGLEHGVTAANAALANGGATTVLQWQDGHRLGRGHPASHLVPALLALGEERDAGADALMSAFVAGYESGTRVGIALGGLAPGLHDGGTWPTLGAAAACTRLLGGDTAEIAAALEGAAAVASLPTSETTWRGATIHHLYIGLGAATAITVSRAVLAGLTTLPGTIERFFGPRAGARFEPALLATGLGDDGGWRHFEMLSAYLKWHPVCAHFSGVAELMHELIHPAEGDGGATLTRDDVRAVRVALSATALAYDSGIPANDLAARFSVTAIVHGSFEPGGLQGNTFPAATLASPSVRQWCERIEVSHDAALDAHYPAGRPTRVTLLLADGSSRTGTLHDVYGDSRRPLSGDDRRRKATTALARRYGPAGADRVMAAFASYLDGGPIGVLTAALRHAPG